MADLKGPQPSPIPAPDRHQIERLNSLYQIIDAAPAAGGLKSRLASGARRLLGRVLSRQQEFNAAVVDHVNRNAAVAIEAHHASVNTIEWVGVAVNRCEAATDEVRRHAEALLARDRRNEAAVAALAAQHDELRAAVSVLQQAAQNLKRELAPGCDGRRSPIPNPESPGSRPAIVPHRTGQPVRRPRQPQVRRLRGSVPRLSRGHPAPRRRISADLSGSGIRDRGSGMCSMSAAAAASSSSCCANTA